MTDALPRLGVVGALALSCALTVVFAGCRDRGGRTAAPSRARLSAEQVADRAKPATVLVMVETTATVQVPEVSIHKEALTLALAGQITPTASAEDSFRKTVDIILANPARFLTRSENTRSKSTTLYGSGSGLIVTDAGHVATNAHVVKPDEKSIKEVLVASVTSWIESDVKGMDEQISRMLQGSTMTAPAKERLVKSLAEYYGQFTTLSGVTTKAFVVTEPAGDDPTKLTTVPCEILRVGTPAPGKDVAILKMEGTDFPTLGLAPSIAATGIRTGSDVHIMGFPGKTTLNLSFSAPSRLVPSQTTGKVSAFRDMGEPGSQWQVIETDTTINHGNSGGPALDATGAVIGLATFSLPDQPGINYVVSVDVVHEFLRELKVTPSTSAFTRAYLTAVADYESGRQDRACSGFRQLQQHRPKVRAVDDFVQMLSKSGQCTGVAATRVPATSPTLPSPASNARDRRDGSGSRRVLVLGGFVVALGVIVVIVVMANRN